MRELSNQTASGLLPLFVLTFILLFSSGVTTPLFITLALTLSLALPRLLTLFLLFRALILFVCHV
jgi:hypothetical protein